MIMVLQFFKHIIGVLPYDGIKRKISHL